MMSDPLIIKLVNPHLAEKAERLLREGGAHPVADFELLHVIAKMAKRSGIAVTFYRSGTNLETRKPYRIEYSVDQILTCTGCLEQKIECRPIE